MDTLKDRLPDHAKDLRVNLSNIARIDTLEPAQRWLVVLASAEAAGSATALADLRAAARAEGIDDAVLTGARIAAALMAMNNVYYRFTHLVADDTYQKMPARLRMTGIARPGVPKPDFELASLAASAINGCGACVAAHEQSARKAGFAPEAIQDAVRIAAIVSAVARTVDVETQLVDAS